ncbi:MAG: WXG100 family type VII secretion target [Clostridiales bacterium]|jgi:WXG100 family type VII secretion target|nr:WXG100 family type VII secretion target [Clostridiales bacterium]
MGDYSTTVTVDILRAKANSLDQVVATYAGAVSAMYQLTEDLNRMWEGGASQAFQTKFERQKEQFEAGARTLRDYAQAMRDSADQYVRTDNEAINIING